MHNSHWCVCTIFSARTPHVYSITTPWLYTTIESYHCIYLFTTYLLHVIWARSIYICMGINVKWNVCLSPYFFVSLSCMIDKYCSVVRWSFGREWKCLTLTSVECHVYLFHLCWIAANRLFATLFNNRAIFNGLWTFNQIFKKKINIFYWPLPSGSFNWVTVW